MGNEQGYAIFMVFLALFSFSALTFAMTHSGRSAGKSTIDGEAAVLDVGISEQCASYIKMGKRRLQILNDCASGQISFELAGGQNANPNARPDKSCHLFHPNGAGLQPCGAYAIIPAAVSPPVSPPPPEPENPGDDDPAPPDEGTAPVLGNITYDDTQTASVLSNGVYFRCSAFGSQDAQGGQCTDWEVSTDGIHFSSKDICFAKNIVERLVRGLLSIATDFGRTICSASCTVTDVTNTVAYGTTGGDIGFYYTTDRTLVPYTGACAGYFDASRSGDEALSCNCWGQE